MAEMDRRGFLALTVGMCATCAFGGNVLAADAKADPVDVGALADFKADGISDKFEKSNKIFVIRNGGRVYAASVLCTHKYAAMNVKGDEIVCPKHNSHFSIEGTPTKGPAKSSLVRYAISLDANGHVIVDTNTEFHEKDYDDKKAYVEVPK